MKVVLMAGGRGTRISELFPDIPKPLIPIQGIPVLEREICSLRDQGFIEIILTIGLYGRKKYRSILETVRTGSKVFMFR